MRLAVVCNAGDNEAFTYLDLKKVNSALNEENVALKNELEQLKSSVQLLNRAALNTAFGESQFNIIRQKLLRTALVVIEITSPSI